MYFSSFSRIIAVKSFSVLRPMFDNNVFEQWLDQKSKELVDKIGSGAALSSEEMIILVLKAQSNHFLHLDQDLRTDMKSLSAKTTQEIHTLKKDIDDRFEHVDQDFDQVDKKFEMLLNRLERFMFWSLGLTISSTLFILGFIKFVG